VSATTLRLIVPPSMISRYEHPRDDLRLQVEAGTVGEDRETDCVQGAKPFAAIPAFGTDQRQLNPLLPQRLAHLVHHLAPGSEPPPSSSTPSTSASSLGTCAYRTQVSQA
jgi:hypothetical protein